MGRRGCSLEAAHAGSGGEVSDVEAWTKLRIPGQKSIPLSLEHGNDPLCSCGKGKDVSAVFMKEREWASAAPFVTRIVIGSIFGVPYAESIGGLVEKMSDAEFKERHNRCARCGGCKII